MYRKLAVLGGCLLALVVATGRLQAQVPAAQPAVAPGATRLAADQWYARQKRDRTLFYVAAPGNGSSLEDGGYGIMVFDRDNNWQFVKRIPLWDYPAWLGPGDFRGISAHADTGRLYVSHNRGVAAFDLRTDKMLWHTDSLNTGNFDNGDCCENSHVTIDGQTIIAGSGGRKDRWWVLDANSGRITGQIPTPDTMRPHNIVMSLDGTRMYLAPNFNGLLSVLDTSTMKVIRTVGPTTGDTKTLTINGAGTRLYSTMDGRYVYNSNGEVFDAATKNKIHQLVDEYGRLAGSEKSLEIVFEGDKVVRVGERYGAGQVRTAGASNQR